MFLRALRHGVLTVPLLAALVAPGLAHASVKPDAPGATADREPRITAVRDAPAVYKEDTWAGGTGIRGKFVFRNGGDDTATRYTYSFDNPDGPFSVVGADPNDPEGRSPEVGFRPDRPGAHFLYVWLQDASGPGPRRTYDILVEYPQRIGRWDFSEGRGSTAADSSGHGHDLTLSPGTEWTDGIGDPAVRFDAPGDDASAGEPVVRTTKGFSVVAFTRLSSLTSTGVVLSQDGAQTSGFGLGYVANDRRCPTYTPTSPGCFEFWMPGADEAGPAPTQRARSPLEAQPGQWVMLGGVYDPRAPRGQKLTVYACTAVGPDPMYVGRAGPVTAWKATGAFHVGQGSLTGGSKDTWLGDVDRALAFDGAVDEAQMMDICFG